MLGHEGAGVVEQVGKTVKGEAGDHVVLSHQSCGRCRKCREGCPTACDSFWDANFGFQRLDGSNALNGNGVLGHFFGQSSFATHVLATERNLVRVPREIPLEILAPLGCGMQTGAGTVMNSLKVPEGASIAVFGTGSVGLAAIMAARLVKANPIIGVDRVAERLELALELGATHAIDNRRNEVASRITDVVRHGVDYVVKTTGDWNMNRIAVDVLNLHGTVALVAGSGGTAALPEGRKAVGIIQGDAVPQQFIPKLISLYLEERFPLVRLIRFYEFWDINKAIEDVKRCHTIKAVLKMSGAYPE